MDDNTEDALKAGRWNFSGASFGIGMILLATGLLFEHFMVADNAWFLSGTIALLYVVLSSHKQFSRQDEDYIALLRQIDQLRNQQRDS